MKDFSHTEIVYRVEGPKERDGMVCATGWSDTLEKAIENSRLFPSGIDRNKCTVIKKTTKTLIEKFSWQLATSGNGKSCRC